MQAEIVYVDDNIVVINKPAGLPCHPLKPGEGPSAFALVVAQFPEVASASNNPLEGGLVHRLDNHTSGLLVFARHPAAYETWRLAFKNSTIQKSYVALIQGKLDHILTLEQPIAHHPKSKHKMVTVGEGHCYFRGHPQVATTVVTPLEISENTTLVRITISGGRRHQIRVHLANAGFPLVGDKLYGGPEPLPGLPGHALHADTLVLPNGQVLIKRPTWLSS